MFLDDRKTFDRRSPKWRSKRLPVLAWLNPTRTGFDLNIVNPELQLNQPIPNTCKRLGEAIEFVYANATWKS